MIVVQAFCEHWRPTTNSLQTVIKEYSILLWDLQIIRDLPVHGSFYKEDIPNAFKLIGAASDGKYFLASSCKYLFHIFTIFVLGMIKLQ